MATERRLCECPQCGREAEGDGVPVTVGGWHGDINYGWGRYAGVHLCKAVAYRCPVCKIQWSAEPDWDQYPRSPRS